MLALGMSGRRIVATAVCVVIAAAAATLLGACGREAVASDADGEASARQWAAAMCAALAPWRAEITRLNSRAQEEMARASSAEQAKTNLLALLVGARTASESALAKLVAAGTPAVPGGPEVASWFRAGLRATAAVYDRAGQDLAALSTADEAAFYTEVSAILERLTRQYARSFGGEPDLRSPVLMDALDQAPECQ